MKNGQSISKSVLAIVVAGIALSVALIWFHFQAPEKVSKPVVAPAAGKSIAQETDSSSKLSPTNKPAPVAMRATGLLPVIPISLTNIINESETAFLLDHDSGLKILPHGTHVFGGIEFWLQGMVHLQGTVSRDDENAHFRTSIDVPLDATNDINGKWVVTPRGRNIACIYLIAATRFGDSTGETFADLVWHYADGTTARNEMKYNVDLRDWWRVPYEDPAQLPNPLTKVAWQGLYPGRNNGSIRLYRIAFVNPHPEKTIHSLELASAMARPSLFVLALTLDPFLPGARPDNLTSAEMADPELGGQLQLLVQDTAGRALPNAQVTVASQSKSIGHISQKFTTDNNGIALVRYPDTGLETLDVTAAHDDYSGRKMRWDVSSGDTVPASWTLKLAAEVKIGGIVVDTDNIPIPGATISLYRFWSGNDYSPDRKGEQPDFSRQAQTTDGEGRWQANKLPPSMLDHIGFEVSHPDFVNTSDNVGQNPATEKQLRDGTYKTILQRGQDVQGKVVDANNYPVPGATVWAGRKYTRNRKQTTSDDQGQFFFHSVETGDQLFSVMAKGLSPADKTVNVQTGMPEIVFQLQPGSVLRAHVQDESGQPVANAHVGLQGNPGDSTYDAYEFNANTDDNGDFSWDSAPDRPMPFYIFHDGFEAKRGVKLKPNQDNIVTMHRSRTVEGIVVDEQSEQPVTKFSIRLGYVNGYNSDIYGVVRYKDFQADDGRFSVTVDEEEDDAVAVYADGYADKIEKLPEAQNGIVQVTVKLKASAGLSGIVLAPDGTPAPGVTVAVATTGIQSFVQLTGGRLRSYGSRNKIATTDEQGHFTISSTPDDGTVIAAGESGFARAPLSEVRNSGAITLQAWGRIEGTLKIGGQPGVGKDLLYNLNLSGIGTDFNGYKATTDDQGQFTMEKVPPGEGAIVRLIKTAPNSWTHSDSTSVMVKAGETTQVSLGDNGAMLVGRIRWEIPPTNITELNIEGNLSGPMPQMPKFNSLEESQAYFRTPEFQAMMRLRKNYAIELQPDGSFTVDDVAPGVYSLNIMVRKSGPNPWANPLLDQGSQSITVPDSFTPTQPIDVGEVMLHSIQSSPSTP